MANRYWVGGSGNWSDTNHWSATSGGVGGNPVPTSSDDVFIDSSSGFESGGIIRAPFGSDITCHDLICTSGHNFTLQSWWVDYATIKVYGSLQLESGVSIGFATLSFYSDEDETCDMGGSGFVNTDVGYGVMSYFSFRKDNGSGKLTLLSDIDIPLSTNGLFFYSGSLDLNDYDVTWPSTLEIATDGDVYLGSGTIKVTSFTTAEFSGNLYSETSTIQMNDLAQFVSMENLTFYDIEFLGSYSVGEWAQCVFTCNNLKFNPNSNLVFSADSSITLNSLTGIGAPENLIAITARLAGGEVTNFEIANGGSGYAVDDWVYINGVDEGFEAWLYVTSVDGSGMITGLSLDSGGNGYTTGNNITTTADGGTGLGLLLNITASAIQDQFTLSKSSGIVECDYLDLSGSIVTGGAAWFAGSHSTDSGNNNGWIFKDNKPTIDNKYALPAFQV